MTRDNLSVKSADGPPSERDARQKKRVALPAGFEEKRVLSPHQTAELLGVSLSTLRRLDKAGKGPAAVRLSTRRLGFRASDVLGYLEILELNEPTLETLGVQELSRSGEAS